MKIQTSVKIELRTQGEGFKLLFKDLENNFVEETTQTRTLLLLSDAPVIEAKVIPRGLVITEVSGKALSFRETEQGLIIVNRITKLIEYKANDFTTITLKGE